MKHCLTILLVISYLVGNTQTNTIYLKPMLTNIGYTADQDSHMVVRNSSTHLNKLFLYIGGTNSTTKNYRVISEYAGKLGFDVINISYPNNVAAASLKSSSDSLVFDKYRQEMCYGTPLSNAVSVDSLNSIYTRTINVLSYLSNTYPEQNWGQYLSSPTSLNFSKVAVGGHSQGAGHACYFGKKELVDRVLMLSGPNDYSDRLSKPARWLRQSGITPLNKQYAYLSLFDEVVDYEKQHNNLVGLGTVALTDTIHVDASSAPFNSSLCLYTTQKPGITLLKHNSTIKFSLLNNDVWEYMLTSNVTTSKVKIETLSSVSIYPNPTKANLTVKVEHNLLGKTYRITSINGATITSGTVSSSTFNIDVSALDRGLYFLNIGNETHSFVKQ